MIDHDDKTILRIAPQLGIGDAETLAEWFLRHAGPELRGQLMADLPLVYARIYPGVRADIILDHVSAALTRIQASQGNAFAALARQHEHGQLQRAECPD